MNRRHFFSILGGALAAAVAGLTTKRRPFRLTNETNRQALKHVKNSQHPCPHFQLSGRMVEGSGGMPVGQWHLEVTCQNCGETLPPGTPLTHPLRIPLPPEVWRLG